MIGDNIDKNVKPRHMRFDKQTKSLHYFNAYAVRDRIDTSHLAEKHTTDPELHLSDFLPSIDDYNALKNAFKVLVSRVLCNHMSFFKKNFSDAVINHIPHKYSKEMSQKSVIVSFYCFTLNYCMW